MFQRLWCKVFGHARRVVRWVDDADLTDERLQLVCLDCGKDL